MTGIALFLLNYKFDSPIATTCGADPGAAATPVNVNPILSEQLQYVKRVLGDYLGR